MTVTTETPRRLLLNGAWTAGEGGPLEDRSPATGELVALVSRAARGQVEAAIDGARAAFRAYRTVPAYRRGEMLHHVSRRIAEREEEFARLIALEVGKPIKTARVEVNRAVFTFRLAAEEAPRITGQTIPMDVVAGGEGRKGLSFRQPVGVVGAITPFNFPLNLVAHKVAPALAAGCTVVLKPASQCPLTALLLGEVLLEAGFRDGVVSVLPAANADAGPLITSPKVAVVSFTGSVPVGKYLRDRAGLKRVVLELGSNSANIVTPSADLEHAAATCVTGGFSFAGQSCISVQRIYVQRSVLGAFLDTLLPKVAALKVGDPLDEATDVGPMVEEDAAARAEAWVNEARAGGAQVLVGGTRQGALFAPTVLTDVRPEMRVVCEEVFAPIVDVIPYDRFDEAVAMVNDSRFGLNAAVFTNDLRETFRAIDELEVGQVIINDASAYRADHMPYGGVKEGGLGREGVHYAIEHYTEIKFASINLP
ncbi:MAG: aldehyde dehydrogenase family protein [Chloroflexi bacterium]|nr:aldehyde dehydrogenase family protein [Chloroflexota bacterium]